MLAASLSACLPVHGLASGMPDFSYAGFQNLPQAQDVVAVVGAPVPAEADWQENARRMCQIWRVRNPKTADLTLHEFAEHGRQLPRGIPWNDTATDDLPLCAFAARELSKYEVPGRTPMLWRVALAYWVNGSGLKYRTKTTAKGMTAEGLTDASWTYCHGVRGNVGDIMKVLGRTKARRSDMMNPFCSIRWWIAEYLEWRAKLGSNADNWRIAGAVFYPARPFGRRVRREIGTWQSIDKVHAAILARL